MARGGKREGAGRKSIGITKKVSLTLSQELWDEINQFDGTAADYIRSLKNNQPSNQITKIKNTESETNNSDMNKVTDIKEQQDQTLERSYLDEAWNTFVDDYKKTKSSEIIALAYSHFINQIYQDKDTPQIETQLHYRSPFTDKFVKSTWDMVRIAVPRSIKHVEQTLKNKRNHKLQQQEELAEKERRERLNKMHKNRLW